MEKIIVDMNGKKEATCPYCGGKITVTTIFGLTFGLCEECGKTIGQKNVEGVMGVRASLQKHSLLCPVCRSKLTKDNVVSQINGVTTFKCNHCWTSVDTNQGAGQYIKVI